MSEAQGSTRPIVIAGRHALELQVARFSVVVDAGPDRGRSVALSAASLRVGTDSSCELALKDQTVSQRHAVFTLTAEGVRVEDLESTNGTWLHEARIQSAVVPDGTTLRVGSTTLRLRCAPERVVVFPDQEPACLGLLGQSQSMRDVFAVIRQLARTDLPVLITGETGTGKELVARALHQGGPRAKRPFLVLDCGAVVPELLRSELFGHEKGAFTGADRATAGILEEAAGGTVMLDEIGEMELSTQPQLLRALEVREVSRLGSRKPVPVDFRIVAATNRDLRQEAAQGRFRQDLYFRLSTVTLALPSLSERKEDLALLARHFLTACARRQQLAVPELSSQALTALEAHAWPGNVRELRNVMEALCVFAAGEPIGADAVGRVLKPGQPVQPAPAAPVTLEEAERQAILAALSATGWNRRAAAERLQIAQSTLYEKLQRHGLKPKRSRD